jgi:uncharacterized protein YndB with AHSA1/START domain
MLKKILLGFAVLVALFAIIVATRPADFRIERSTQINAPAEVIFAQVNNFKNWNAWSPWARLDPNMTTKIDGPPEGVGATYVWIGNDQVGEGRMTITESKPNEKIGIRLEFIKPWEATNAATFVFDSRGQGTQVTWLMEGTNTFMGKAIGMFMDMDALIGSYFEKGLAQMKTVAEAEQHKHVATEAATVISAVG